MNRNTVTNKQYRTYSSLSRYQTFPIYFNLEDNKYIYGTTDYLNDTTAS